MPHFAIVIAANSIHLWFNSIRLYLPVTTCQTSLDPQSDGKTT